MKKETQYLVIGVVVLGGFYLMANQPKATSVPKSKRENSLETLLPTFRKKIDVLLQMMVVDGFDPFVFESRRSKERAKDLSIKGTGIEESQHTIDAAVDILDRKALWKTSQAFFDALHRNSLALGLGRIKHKDKNGKVDWDWAHVQALPGNQDKKLYALGDAAKREEFLRKTYKV